MFAYCNNNPVMQIDPTGAWAWGTQFAIGVSILLVGVAVLTAIPTGGASLAVAGAAIGNTLVLAGATVSAAATVGASIDFAKKSRKSDKEKAKDRPSYVTRNDIDPNKTAQENATDILNRKFGSGNWNKGPGSDFNKIVKWIHRSLMLYLLGINDERWWKDS